MRKLFASRWFRVTALVWVVGFFVVFVPAHRRGIVTLPTGLTTSATAEDANGSTSSSPKPFCPLCSFWPGQGEDESVPTDAPMTCAICHLKANLITPPTAVLPPVFVDELEFALYERRELELISASPQHRILGRAPPVMS